ncbi:MAG: hypothetical protein K0R05_1077 [Anaerocolumna sp.]|jgi:hypothetical protein|nr:hypothetical protein [Anaerocolumna sp.]
MYDEDEIDDLSDEDFADIEDDYSYLNEWRDDEDFDDYDDEESDDSEDE